MDNLCTRQRIESMLAQCASKTGNLLPSIYVLFLCSKTVGGGSLFVQLHPGTFEGPWGNLDLD